MNTNHLVGLSLLAYGCAYTAPENFNSQTDALNTISGTILAQGVEDPGYAMVLVYDASNPGPPLGTGRPLTFTTVPASAFTDNGAGIKSAPYAIPYLPDSDPGVRVAGAKEFEHSGYHVTVLLDQDANASPFAAGLQGATFGDYVGAHLADIETGVRGDVTVSGGELKNDVTIVVTDHITLQRPAFSLPTLPVIDMPLAQASGVDPALTQSYRIQSVGVHTSYGKNQPLDLYGPCDIAPEFDQATCDVTSGCPCDEDTLDPAETAFWVMFVDADGDGAHDPYPDNPDGTPSLQALNGITDTWPRMFIEYMGTPAEDKAGNQIFDNDLKQFEWPPGSGIKLPERWVQENFTMAYDLNFLGPFGIAPEGAPFNTPFPVNQMQVTYSPVARHYYKDGTYGEDDNGPYDLIDIRCFTQPDGSYPEFATCDGGEHDSTQIPKGAWKMTLISFTGQTWFMPNEIGSPNLAYDLGMFSTANGGFDGAMESTDASFSVEGQAGYLTTK